MSKDIVTDEEVNHTLEEGMKICDKLNAILYNAKDGNRGISLGLAYYSVARFAAEFLYKTRPDMEDDDILGGFNQAVANIYQAFCDDEEDEGEEISISDINNEAN